MWKALRCRGLYSNRRDLAHTINRLFMMDQSIELFGRKKGFGSLSMRFWEELNELTLACSPKPNTLAMTSTRGLTS